MEGGPKEKRDRQPPKQFPTQKSSKDKAGANTKKKKPTAAAEKFPVAKGVDLMWEAGQKLVHPCPLMPAMQDCARLDMALLDGDDVEPNLSMP